MAELNSPPSPVDAMPGTMLEARVVRPGPRPLLHGYDVQSDLAGSFSFAEVILTALTGEAPSEAAGRAMSVALTFACPISVAEAPSHAATLARRCGADHRGVLGVAAIALAEQAQQLASSGDGALDDGEAVSRLRTTLEAAGVSIPDLDAATTLWQALRATLAFCGLTEEWQVTFSLTLARLPVVVAEAMTIERGALDGYPMRLPAFAYDEGVEGE